MTADKVCSDGYICTWKGGVLSSATYKLLFFGFLVFMQVNLVAMEKRDYSWALDFLQGAAENEMRIAVDASELPETGLLHSRSSLMVANEGLRFPRWIPGIHAPAGAVENVAGLYVRDAAGQRISWKRDPRDPWRIRLPGVDGPRRVSIDIAHISNQPHANSKGIDTNSADGYLICNWNNTFLYNEQSLAVDQKVKVCIRLPIDWSWGCGLKEDAAVTKHASCVFFKETDVAGLVDCPLVASASYKKIKLSEAKDVYLHVFGENEEALHIHDHWIEGMYRLPVEAEQCFGGSYYDTYDFLLLAVDNLNIGLEHRTSSLNSLTREVLREKTGSPYDFELMPHEYVHSWCGKYRRPEGMWTRHFHETKQLDGLWIYEGLTQYYGSVLAVRSGLLNESTWRTQCADMIYELSKQEGRDWRSIRDCCLSSMWLREYSERHHGLRRGQDYYLEGALFWLAADLRIRFMTKNEKSLDDFCRAFFGPLAKVGPFNEAELIAALNSILPYDWKGEIDKRIDAVAPELNIDFLDFTGWELSEVMVQFEDEDVLFEFNPSHALRSIGLGLYDGWVREVVPNSATARAQIKEGDYIHSINSIELEEDPDILGKAILMSPVTKVILCHVFRDDEWTFVPIEYDGGLSIKKLVRNEEKHDYLADILNPRSIKKSSESLLNSIIAAQSKIKSATGFLDYRIIYTKDKERSPAQYKVKLQIVVPNKYNILAQQDDLKERFISDGKTEWHVEDVGGDTHSSEKDLETGKGKFADIVTNFIPLRRENLEKDFHMNVTAVGLDCEIKGAVSVIELRPIAADQKDHLKYSKVYLDNKFQLVCVQTLDADHNLYDFRVQKMEYNVALPDDTFIYSSR